MTQLRAAQALLAREREHREGLEEQVRAAVAEEMAQANAAALEALDRADDATAHCRQLEVA